MKTLAILLLVAALLPYFAVIAAKAGGKGFDNNAPREWLAKQEGWRSRASAAQSNLLEGLPFFFAAVLFALYAQVEPAALTTLVAAWIAVRIAYIAIYIADYGVLRSLVWGLALAINIAILFKAV